MNGRYGLKKNRMFSTGRLPSYASMFQEASQSSFLYRCEDRLKQIAGQLGQLGALALLQGNMGIELLALHFFDQIA